MAERSRRLRKKLHKQWLQDLLIDASQHSRWREKLFAAEAYTPFPINEKTCSGLPQGTVESIKKYGLRYVVARVPSSEAESWLSEGGSLIFKFWAEDLPELKMFSGNDPDVA